MSRINISKETPFECTFNGEALSIEEMTQIHAFYRASSTAEYLKENNPSLSCEEALQIGWKVRDLMNDKNLDEEEAIACVFSDMGLSMG